MRLRFLALLPLIAAAALAGCDSNPTAPSMATPEQRAEITAPSEPVKPSPKAKRLRVQGPAGGAEVQ